MKKTLLSAAILSSFFATAAFTAPAQADDFCGQIDSIIFKEFRGKIGANLVLTKLVNETTGQALGFRRIEVIDPQVVFKIARAISKSSVQNPQQLAKDLAASNFEWDANASSEEHPNPYVEDFVACLSAPLDQLRTGNILPEVSDINDIREDGSSILDLIY